MKKLNKVIADAKNIKKTVLDRLKNIPENQVVTKIPGTPNCYSIKLSALSRSEKVRNKDTIVSNWDPKYNSMVCAAKAIAEEIESVHIEDLEEKLSSMISTQCSRHGRFCPEMMIVLQKILDDIK